ncbi:MAG: LCP family protein [Chloroflexota bacterium]|nr:LCP family protein [Chloroflexota bacterium]
MRLARRFLMAPTTRRVALKGLAGATAMAATLRAPFAHAQDDEDDDVKPATFRRPQTLIVAGLDSRQEGEPENSDVFMIAQVDLQAKTVRAISVPRDLYLEIPGFGADKITRAYDFGSKSQNGKFKAGAELMKATVEYNFGLEVDSVVVTTFHGFEDIVDAFAPLEIELPYAVSDSEYPTLDYGYMSISFPEGPQEVNGEQALQLCRTRHQDGDPGRVMRQQIVLRALLTKASSPEYADQLWDIVKENKKKVRTDLGPSKQLTYALAVPDFSNEGVKFATLQDFVYDDTAANGMWIYSGMWEQIPGFVAGFLNGTIEVEQIV